MANFTKLLSPTVFDASAGAEVSADAVSSGVLLPAPEAPELSAEAVSPAPSVPALSAAALVSATCVFLSAPEFSV